MNIEEFVRMAVEQGLVSAIEAEQAEIIAAQQARIDALMLEFCPNEMTTEQIANWSVHQKTQEIGEQK